MSRLLECKVQEYAWGKRGRQSAVGRLRPEMVEEGGGGEERALAELWMGSHVNGPSRVLPEGALLGDFVAPRELPFLFKVLSVRVALSVQAHPDARLAQRLHAQRPQVYRDANHKPELAVALSRFEVLCQFQEEVRIARWVRECPELAGLVGREARGVRAWFSAVMRSAEQGQRAARAMTQRLLAQAPDELEDAERLVLRLAQTYPGDVGLFVPFFLNHFTLRPGEAVFLGPNEPHAYLSGDCIECMAASDNVVRAGLTAKLRDTETLLEMLTYRCGMPEVMRPDAQGAYIVPVDDFQVVVARVAPRTRLELPARRGDSIALLTEGSGVVDGDTPVRMGSAVLITPEHAAVFEAHEEEIVLYIAMAKQ